MEKKTKTKVPKKTSPVAAKTRTAKTVRRAPATSADEQSAVVATVEEAAIAEGEVAAGEGEIEASTAPTGVAVTNHVAEFKKHVTSLLTWLKEIYPNDTACQNLTGEAAVLLKSAQTTKTFLTQWMLYMTPYKSILDVQSCGCSAEEYVILIEGMDTIPIVKDIRPKDKFLRKEFSPKKRKMLIDSLRQITAAALAFSGESTEGKYLAKLLGIANKFAAQFKSEELRKGNLSGLMLAIPELLKGEDTLDLLSSIIGNDEEFGKFIEFIEGSIGDKIQAEYRQAIRTAIHEYTKVVQRTDFRKMIETVKPALEPILTSVAKVYEKLEACVKKNNGGEGATLGGIASAFLGRILAGGGDDADEENAEIFRKMKACRNTMEKEFGFFQP